MDVSSPPFAYLYYQQINSSCLEGGLARGGNYKRPYVERDGHKKVNSIYSGLMVQAEEFNSLLAVGHVCVSSKFSKKGRNQIPSLGNFKRLQRRDLNKKIYSVV